MEQETTLRKVLQNEFTWILMILGAGWACVTTIIIPLNTIQTQVAQIQQNQLDATKFQQKIQVVDDGFNSRISVLESKIELATKK